MSSWVGVPWALAAATAFSTSGALKHDSAQQAADPFAGRGLRATGAFVADTIRHPRWLAAIVVDVVGVSLQVVALHVGGLVVVQPLLVTGLIGALFLRARSRRGVARRLVLWAGGLCAALAVLTVSIVSAGGHRSQAADHGPALVSVAVVATGVLVALAVARRTGSTDAAATTLGAAAGLTFAGAAALLTVLTAEFRHGGLSELLAHPELYLLLGVGLVSQVLTQTAFRAGPLSASAPATAVVDVLASVALGIFVFDENVPRRAGHIALVTVSLVAVLVCCFRLSRAEARWTEQ